MYTLSDFNGKVIEVYHGDHEDDGSFLAYRGNGDILTPPGQMPFWAEGVVGVSIHEYNSYWATALPAENAAVMLASDRIDIRNLNLVVVDPASVSAGSMPEFMDQEADAAFRMGLVNEVLKLDLSVTDASDAVPSPEGYVTVAERDLDLSYLDVPGNDEVTLAEAEAEGFPLVSEKEQKAATGS